MSPDTAGRICVVVIAVLFFALVAYGLWNK